MPVAPTPDSEQTGPPEASPLSALRPHARARRLDAPLRTMLGLAVLWGSLMLVFRAHTLSDSFIRPDLPGFKALSQEQNLVRALEPQVKLRLPFSAYFRGVSARKALESIVSFPEIGLRIAPTDLDRLDKESRTYHFEGLELYKIIHEILDSTRLGFALDGNNLLIFKQNLARSNQAGHKLTLEWSAPMTLLRNRNRLIVVPSGETELWFAVALRDDLTDPKKPGLAVQVEVYKGTELLTMSRARLDEQGSAQLSMSTAENIAFALKRAADQPDLYQLNFYYQSFE